MNAGFSRTPFRLASRAQAVWQYRPVPSLSGLLPPSPASPGSGCPQLQPACCDSPAVKVSHPHPNPQRLVAHLIHEPPIPGSVPGRASGVDELLRERLHPPLHRHVIHLDTSLSQQLLHIAIGQPVTQIPPHRHRDHLTRKPVAGRC